MNLTVSFKPQILEVEVVPKQLGVAFEPPIARDNTFVDRYDGEYVVIPQASDAVTLSTKDKLLLDDVTVTKVPYWETSNQSGGLTAYIASEV